eukprot:CAMPEP_0198212140 /NCGR_PEP_ID=MMETSP1445-20131203/25544_1 /TAXON_ID=36898 /ORGANISM="Pyramimonas sp., Strain CCMP2087" /LENGTH=250 /DNA_ID=CAMNT_0043886525 /DNA_START=89 /DNA_END=841 /DNA_ORIENTATION=-
MPPLVVSLRALGLAVECRQRLQPTYSTCLSRAALSSSRCVQRRTPCSLSLRDSWQGKKNCESLRSGGPQERRVGRSAAFLAAAMLGSHLFVAAAASEGSDWKVLPIAGDGRCLFRSVAQGAAVRANGKTLASDAELKNADDLRAQAMDELTRRREETEWFIEGDFALYVRGMRVPNAWGGEAEILMLTHVLQAPISVYLLRDNKRDNKSLTSIGDYGQDYAEEGKEPIRILFHGAGHYEAILQLPPQPRL